MTFTPYTDAEKLANDVLRAAGSGLHNYTMPATRKAIIDAATRQPDPLVTTLAEALKGAMDILGRAESNASGMGAEWDYVGPRVAACRAALAKAGVA